MGRDEYEPTDAGVGGGFSSVDPDETGSETAETTTERLHSMGYDTGGGAEPSHGQGTTADSGRSERRADLVRLLAVAVPALLVLAFLWVSVVRPLF
jgi:hypothetical protein